MREREIEMALIDRARALGGHAYKWTSPGRVGVPDRIVVLPGRVLFVECKAPGREPAPHQLREIGRLRSLGQQVEVIDTLERLDEVLPT